MSYQLLHSEADPSFIDLNSSLVDSVLCLLKLSVVVTKKLQSTKHDIAIPRNRVSRYSARAMKGGDYGNKLLGYVG